MPLLYVLGVLADSLRLMCIIIHSGFSVGDGLFKEQGYSGGVLLVIGQRIAIIGGSGYGDPNFYNIHLHYSEFTIDKEGFLEKFYAIAGLKDINIEGHSDFSNRFYLLGEDEEAIDAKTAALGEAAGKLAERAYAQQNAEAGEAGDSAEAAESADPSVDDAVDAEFEEVKEDKDKAS